MSGQQQAVSGRRWFRASTLLALLVAWVLLPHRWEGPVVWSITDTHGVHVADLIGLAIAGVAGWFWLR